MDCIRLRVDLCLNSKKGGNGEVKKNKKKKILRREREASSLVQHDKMPSFTIKKRHSHLVSFGAVKSEQNGLISSEYIEE